MTLKSLNLNYKPHFGGAFSYLQLVRVTYRFNSPEFPDSSYSVVNSQLTAHMFGYSEQLIPKVAMCGLFSYTPPQNPEQTNVISAEILCAAPY